MMTVVFSGENPGLTLVRPGSDVAVARASYWRCVYSAHGEGNALLLWVDADSSGLGEFAPHGVYADNPGVARLVAQRFTQHFEGFKDHGFGDMDVTHARFFQESDSRWYHRIVANDGDGVIELVWWDVLDYQMRLRSGFELGPTTWDLATVICPCASAEIRVNNHPVQGEVRSSTEGDQPSSSAFLAFSETWVETG